MARPRTDKAMSPAERVRRYRERRRAAGLRAVTRWRAGTPIWSDHRVQEARSLALHVLAARVRRQKARTTQPEELDLLPTQPEELDLLPSRVNHACRTFRLHVHSWCGVPCTTSDRRKKCA